jgi:hypothetical protein
MPNCPFCHRTADAFVFPSTKKGGGLVVLEASRRVCLWSPQISRRLRGFPLRDSPSAVSVSRLDWPARSGPGYAIDLSSPMSPVY